MDEPPLPPIKSLTRDYFARSTPIVARDLLGTWMLRRLGRTWLGGRIVETEAYLHEADLASHSSSGLRVSNAAMFEAPGTIYVYPIHAKYCFNISTESAGQGAAVLVRALEPLWGIETMIERRGVPSLYRLTSGPAMLCQALAIDRSFNGRDLCEVQELAVVQGEALGDDSVGVSPRIGINKSGDLPLRYFIRGNRFVSGPKYWHQR